MGHLNGKGQDHSNEVERRLIHGEHATERLSDRVTAHDTTLKEHSLRIKEVEKKWSRAMEWARHLLVVAGLYSASAPVKGLGELLGGFLKYLGKAP